MSKPTNEELIEQALLPDESGRHWDGCWSDHHRCLARLLAQRLKAMTESRDGYRAVVKDTVDGMECLPKCDSYGHEDDCPVANPQAAFRELRERLSQQKVELRECGVDLIRLQEEIDRLKEPGPCGKHPAACVDFPRFDDGLITGEAKTCSACASEREAVEKERENLQGAISRAIGHFSCVCLHKVAVVFAESDPAIRSRGGE